MARTPAAAARWVFILGVVAWAGAAGAQGDDKKLLASATKVWQAVQDCDLPLLARELLTRDEFATYTKKTSDESRYQELVDDWLESTVKPFCDAPKAGFRLRVGQAQVKNMVTLPEGGRRKRALVIAFVTVRVFVESGSRRESEGKEIEPIMLVDHGGAWRILVHK
jgi:hypothetical protein